MAKKSFTTQTEGQPYFLLELNSVFDTKLYDNQERKGHIMGIISKFYSYNSYTSSNTGDSLTFVYDGVFPAVLSSCNVKILNPDYSPANIGDNNSIFLEIVKAKREIEPKTTSKDKFSKQKTN